MNIVLYFFIVIYYGLDYHVCDSKFSREVRIVRPLTSPLNLCSDISDLFKDLTVSNGDTELEHTQSAMWWVWKHHGFTPVVNSRMFLFFYFYFSFY